MVPSMVGDFKQLWEQLGEDNQVTETFQLPAKNLVGKFLNSLIHLLIYYYELLIYWFNFFFFFFPSSSSSS